MNPFLELRSAELLKCDVFGEPQQDAAAVAPCRSIAVTDEMRAADAAAQAEREARIRSTWQPPKSLPPLTYVRKPQLSVRKSTGSQKPKPALLLPPPPPQPERTKLRVKTTFKLNDPVAITDLPPAKRMRGLTSPFVPIFEALQKLKTGKSLPVTVADKKAGYAIQQSVRKMADKAGQKLEHRYSDDYTTFYFWLTEKPAETK